MTHLNEREYWFWLCNIDSIGSVLTERLLAYFKEPGNVYNAGENELKEVEGIKEGRIRKIISSKNPEKIRYNLKRMEKMGIRFLSFADEEFPEKLKSIEHMPYGIYVRGNLPDVRFPVVAVVGARECSGYGRDVARYLSCELSKRGVQIISGMARGVDSAAHYGALSSSSPTFAVLGCGLDICYPLENYSIFCEMGRRGGIISEYPAGTKPSPGNFPYRNRIIAGLCDAILVVEAREKSGSLITANFALSQGKDVFAVPGRIGDTLSKGCNDLIKLGAGLVQTPDDILDALEISFPHLCRVFEGKEDGTAGRKLSPKEDRVYKLLGTEPKHISRVMEESGLSFSEVVEALFEMERVGLIAVCGQNYYRRVMDGLTMPFLS